MQTPFLQKVGKVRLAVYRFPLPEYIKGVLSQPSPRIVYVTANIQPLERSTNTFFLPEEASEKKGLVIYSKQELKSKLENTSLNQQSDRFFWDNEEFEITKVLKYRMGILDHYEAVALVVNPPKITPIAEFSFSVSVVGSVATVTLTNQSQFGTSYKWDIGANGTTDYTTKNAVHQFTTSGTYPIKLIVSNGAGTNEITKFVTVAVGP